LNVSAKDLGTGKEQKITITPSSGLSKEEIERMIKEAREYEKEDQKRRETAETRNAAENLIYQTEKFLKEQADKVSSEHKRKVEEAIENLKSVIKNNDTEQIKKAMDAVTSAMQVVSSELYSRAKSQRNTKDSSSGGTSGSSQKQGKKGDDNVIDADFEMVDDNKK